MEAEGSRRKQDAGGAASAGAFHQHPPTGLYQRSTTCKGKYHRKSREETITMFKCIEFSESAQDAQMLHYATPRNAKTHNPPLHCLLSAKLLRKLTPGPQLMSILEHDKRNQTKQSSEKRKDKTSVLAPDVVEEGAREQRRDSTKGVPHETLARNGRRTRLAVAISRVRVSRLEDEEDAECDGCKADGGRDPRDVSVLCERVDEQADRQPDSAEHGAVETVLGNDLDSRVGLEFVVLAHLEVVRGPAEEGADGEGDVGEAGDALVPAALLAEGDGDDGQEEEDDGPAEGDPHAEGENNGFGDEHADGLDGR